MDIEQSAERKKLWLVRLWSGQIPLAKAFWLYGVLVFGVVYGIGTKLDVMVSPLADIGGDILLGLDFIYAVVWSVGVWRSAGKYEGFNLWRILAYISVIGEVINIIRVLGYLYTSLGS